MKLITVQSSRAVKARAHEITKGSRVTVTPEHGTTIFLFDTRTVTYRSRYRKALTVRHTRPTD